jgi:hypothetical protein
VLLRSELLSGITPGKQLRLKKTGARSPGGTVATIPRNKPPRQSGAEGNSRDKVQSFLNAGACGGLAVVFACVFCVFCFSCFFCFFCFFFVFFFVLTLCVCVCVCVCLPACASSAEEAVCTRAHARDRAERFRRRDSGRR